MATTNPQHQTPPDVRRILDALAEKRHRLMGLPAEKAMEEILDHPKCMALVQSFPEEDLYLLIQEIGPDDALPLLSLASNRQWQFCVDMEIWDRDRIHPQRFARWMQLLLHADPERFIKWVLNEQLEPIERFLNMHVEVFILEHDMDPSDFPDDTFTYDGIYYIRFRNTFDSNEGDPPPSLEIEPFLNDFFNHLYDQDNHSIFQNLLLESRWIIPSEIEDEAYRLKCIRLAEKGFLPYEEAISLYQPLDPGHLLPRISRPSNQQDARDPTSAIPSIVINPEQHPIDIGFDEMRDDPLFLEILSEIGALANQIAVADRVHLSSREDLAGLIRKVRAYLGIGIEILSKAPFHPRTAAQFLRLYPLSAIFRVGYGRIMLLHRQTDHWVRKSWFRRAGMKLDFWEEDGMAVIGGILLPRPKYYDSTFNDSSYREFGSLAEIQNTQHKLDTYRMIDAILENLCADLSSDVLAAFRSRHLTYPCLLLTLHAASRMHTPTEELPLDPLRFQTFFESLWADPHAEGQKHISEGFQSDFLQWLSNAIGVHPSEMHSRLGNVFHQWFQDIESELGWISTDRIDQRFVRMFWIGNILK
ncbi:MAG: DUF6178 family protein [Thermodesulfobacteriota bacterium]